MLMLYDRVLQLRGSTIAYCMHCTIPVECYLLDDSFTSFILCQLTMQHLHLCHMYTILASGCFQSLCATLSVLLWSVPVHVCVPLLLLLMTQNILQCAFYCRRRTSSEHSNLQHNKCNTVLEQTVCCLKPINANNTMLVALFTQ